LLFACEFPPRLVFKCGLLFSLDFARFFPGILPGFLIGCSESSLTPFVDFLPHDPPTELHVHLSLVLFLSPNNFLVKVHPRFAFPYFSFSLSFRKYLAGLLL